MDPADAVKVMRLVREVQPVVSSLQAMSVPLQDEYAASRVSKSADEQVDTTTWPLAVAW